MHQHHRSNLRLRSELTLLLIVVAVIAGACATPKRDTTSKPPAQSPTSANDDACPHRLHDIEGGLLLYYASHKKLPPNLSALVLPGLDTAAAVDALVCPVSSQPYVYDPRGVPAPDGTSRLIVYDSTPAHAGRRWAISIVETDDTQPLVAKVIAVPEASFAAPVGRQ